MAKGLTETLARASILAVYHAYYNDLSYIALQEGVTTGMLLNEEWSDKDAQALADVSTQIEKVVLDLKKQLFTASGNSPEAKTAWAGIIAAIEDAMKPVGPSEIINLKNEDPAKLGEKTAELTKVMQKVVGEIAAIVDLVTSTKQDFANLKVPDDMQGKTIGDLSNLANNAEAVAESKSQLYNLLMEQTTEEPATEEPATGEPTTFEFPDIEKLKGAITKAYQVPASFKDRWQAGAKAAGTEANEEGEKGFFGKAVNFVKGMFGASGAKDTIVDGETIAAAIAATPFSDFLALNLDTTKAALDPVADSAGEETTSMNTSAQAADPDAEPAGDTAADDAPSPEDAITQLANETLPPGLAIKSGLETWLGGMADTSKKTLQAKGRMQGLQTAVDDTMNSMSKTVEKQVRSVVNKWRKEHGVDKAGLAKVDKDPTHVKAFPLANKKNFSAKNWAELEVMIPHLAAQMMQKTNESTGRFTVGTIHRSVYRYLDNRYLDTGLLIESSRWNKLAGLGED